MPKKNTMSVDFSGVDVYLRQLSQFEGATKAAVSDAMRKTQGYIAEKAATAAAKHTKYAKSERPMLRSIIKNGEAIWTGSKAEIAVGFDILDGGLPSIFLMYGTKLHGQPHIAPDREMFNAVYGSATKKAVRQLQEQAFDDVLKKVMK